MNIQYVQTAHTQCGIYLFIFISYIFIYKYEVGDPPSHQRSAAVKKVASLLP